MPPHCPYSAAQAPGGAEVEVGGTDEVLEVAAVLLGGFVDPFEESLTVTTLWAGRAMLIAPPESVTGVDAKVWLLSMSQPEAELGVKPEKETEPVC